MDDYDLADDLIIKKNYISIEEILKDIIYKNINYEKIKKITIEELIKNSQNLLLEEKIYNLEYYSTTITQNYLLTNDLLFLMNIFKKYDEELKIQDLYDIYFESIKNNYFISFKYLSNVLEYNSSIELLCYINNLSEFLKYLLSKNKIIKNSETFFKAIYYNCFDFLEELHNNKCIYDLSELRTIFIPYKCFKFLNENHYNIKENIPNDYILQIIRNFDYNYLEYFINNGFNYTYDIIYPLIDYYYNIFNNYLNNINNSVKYVNFNDTRFYLFEKIYFLGSENITFSTTTDIKNFYNNYIETLDIKGDNKDVEYLKNLVSLLLQMKNNLQTN